MPPLFLILLMSVPAPVESPPVLLEPRAVRRWVREQPDLPVEKVAEGLLLTGDFAGARALVGEGLRTDTPERLRLQVDTYLALQDRHVVDAAVRLEQFPAWEQHGRKAVQRWVRESQLETWTRIGLFTFAICLGLLVLGGSRELLRPRFDALVVGAALGLALLVLGQISKPLMNVFGLFGVAGLALAHAGTATVRRTQAMPRPRTLIATLMLLGLGGAGFAVFGRIGLGPVLSLLG